MQLSKTSEVILKPWSASRPPWLKEAREVLRECGASGLAEARKLAFLRTICTLEKEQNVNLVGEITVPFVTWCLEKSGINTHRSLHAEAFSSWGTELEDPITGSLILVEEEKEGEKHITLGFWVGAVKNDQCKIITGEEFDAVVERVIPNENIVSYRWPLLITGVRPRG